MASIDYYKSISMLNRWWYTRVFPGQAWRQRTSQIPSSLVPLLKVVLMGDKAKTIQYATAGAQGGFLVGNIALKILPPPLVVAAAALGGYSAGWLTLKLLQGRDPGLDNKDRSGKVDLDYGKLKFFRQREMDWHNDGINFGNSDKKAKDAKYDRDIGTHTTSEWKDKIYTTTDDTNTKSTTPPQFVFLDCGRWKGKARDFGLVWGRHVYLCHYDYSPFGASINDPLDSKVFDTSSFGDGVDNYKDRLDYIFFKTFDDGANQNTCGRIKIQAYTCAEYGEDTDYDWLKATVIIPDLHLMAMDVGKIWYRFLSPRFFNLDAEVALLNFSETLVKIGKDTLNVVQIGDAYDLWVDIGGSRNKNDLLKAPFFNKNDYQKFSIDFGQTFYMELGFDSLGIYDPVPDEINMVELVHWIKEIKWIGYKELVECKKEQLLTNSGAYKNWRDHLTDEEKQDRSFYDGKTTPITEDKMFLNPAELAMRLLQDAFGREQMKYIYGNHDNYLIDADLTKAAGLWDRVAMYHDKKSLFIEHAHRMEAELDLPGVPDFIANHIPKNHDGSWSGFKTTNDVYLAAQYWKEGPSAEDKRKTQDMRDFEDGKSEVADRWGGLDQQASYQKRFAEYWMGRVSVGLAPYNITVIGHTHMPALFNYYIEAPQPDPAPAEQDDSMPDTVGAPAGFGGDLYDPFDNLK